MTDLAQITRNIIETSVELDVAERRMLQLAMTDPGDIGGMNTLRRTRAGLIARLDRQTQPPDAVVLRAAS